MTIKGKYNSALIMSDHLDEATLSQLYLMMEQPSLRGEPFRIMADAHAGKGSCVGFTFKMNEYIIPNLCGVDIGCGIYGYNLGDIDVDFKGLDSFIRENIPSGFNINHSFNNQFDLPTEIIKNINSIISKLSLDNAKVFYSLGTLGGGNHFIELNKDPDGNIWLVIHSGSRNFGLQVCNYHQKKAKEFVDKALITGIPNGMEYLPIDMGGQEYLEDMNVAQLFAHYNREIIARVICEGFFNIDLPEDRILSVHNYINFEDKIIRKGAIQANLGQRCIIPFNMRDGIAVCIGKGNKKWNNSAPHGAGRIMSRSQAKKEINLEDYKKSMEGIYSSCVKNSTIDESPFVYKEYSEVINNMQETVDVQFIMKPIYNFKAS